MTDLSSLKALRLREAPSRESLREVCETIQPLSPALLLREQKRWDSLCKPLHSLGLLERIWAQIRAIQGGADDSLRPALSLVFGADNGIVREGVTQCGPEVTAQVLKNMCARKSTLPLFDEAVGWDSLIINLGTAVSTEDCPEVLERCIRQGGTRNFLREAAMTERESLQAIFYGYDLALEAKKQGLRLLAGGEMGIGNSSTSTCLAAVLLGIQPSTVCGRGAGLSDEAFQTKKEVIDAAARRIEPDSDPLTCLTELGGLDLAALCGLYLGAAAAKLPVLLDGLMSFSAAAVAYTIAPSARDYWIPTHFPAEPCAQALMRFMDIDPPLHFQLALGEGAGALLMVPLLEMTRRVYRELPSFEAGSVEAYQDFQDREGQS